MSGGTGKNELSIKEIRAKKCLENLCLANETQLSYNFFNIINLYAIFMNDPIDIKTKKNYLEKNRKIFDKTLVYELLEYEIMNSWDSWGKFQQQWCNNAFNTFKDYDKYLLMIYLFRQVMQSLADKFQSFSMDEFYEQDGFIIDKINLIQISEELKIPKETIRRKINEFQDMGLLRREGKQIILNKSVIEYQIPKQSINLLSIFIQKQAEILKGKVFFGESVTKEEIKLHFEKYYSVFWLRFYKLQIPFLTRWREEFIDLETWNVWGVVALNHQYNLKKLHDKNIFKDNKKINVNNFYLNTVRAKVGHGINASSISDISGIPRATVIRKLKWINKQQLIKKNKELEYLMDPKGKKNKKINKLFMENRGHVTSFVTDVLELIKNSRFTI